MRTRSLRFLALLISLALIAVACGGPEETNADDPPDAEAEDASDTSEAHAAEDAGANGELQPVTLRFTWTYKGEYAPLYLALERGYFEEEGIDLEMVEGSGAQTVFSVVARGEEELAFGPGISAAEAVSQGMPMNVIALWNPAAPMVYISWPDNPVHEPADLEGMTLTTSIGETSSDFLPVFCDINDVDCDAINTPTVDSGARVSQFMAEEVDVVGVYRSNDLPILEAEAGLEFETLDLPEHGVELPGSALITSQQMVDDDPEMLRSVLRAANRGFEDAIDDPAAAADAMLEHWDTDLDPDIVTEQVRALTEAVPEIQGEPLGYQEEELWRNALDMLVQAGLIDEADDLDTYYTNDLLE